jgi:hypothetical protein
MAPLFLSTVNSMPIAEYGRERVPNRLINIVKKNTRAGQNCPKDPIFNNNVLAHI